MLAAEAVVVGKSFGPKLRRRASVIQVPSLSVHTTRSDWLGGRIRLRAYFVVPHGSPFLLGSNLPTLFRLLVLGQPGKAFRTESGLNTFLKCSLLHGHVPLGLAPADSRVPAFSSRKSKFAFS